MTWGCLSTLRNLDMADGATWSEKDDYLGQEITILRYLASETPESEGTKYFRGVCISTIACGSRRCVPSVSSDQKQTYSTQADVEFQEQG